MRIAVNFVFDTPAGLESVFIDVMGIDSMQYNLLYSLYSWPNVVAAIVGGLLVDRCLGKRLGLVVFLVVACVGQLTFAVGVFVKTFWIMGLGRFFIGIGCELSLVIGNVFLANLFSGREMNFAFGMDAIASRLGGTIALYAGYPLFNWFGFISTSTVRLSVVLLVGLLVIILATVITIVLVVMDRQIEAAGQSVAEPSRPRFAFRDIFKLSLTFWLVTVIIAMSYSVFFSSVTTGEVFYISKYSMSVGTANIANTVTYIVSLPSPLVGLLIDRVGYNVYWGVSGILSIILAQVLLAGLLPATYIPYLGSAFVGISYIIVTSGLISVIALLVPEQLLGTAYGIASSSQNVFAALVALAAGLITDRLGYFVLHIFYLVYLYFALSATFLLLYIVGHNVHRANMSGCKAKMLEQVLQRGYHDITDEDLEILVSSQYVTVQQF